MPSSIKVFYLWPTLTFVLGCLVNIHWSDPQEKNVFPSYCFKLDDIQNKTDIQPLQVPLNWSKDGEDDGLKLVQAQIILRHGARTPSHSGMCWEGYDPEWTCDVRFHVLPALERASDPIESSRYFDKIFDNGTNVLRGNCEIGNLLDEGYLQQMYNGEVFRRAYVGNGSKVLFQSEEQVHLSNVSDIYLSSDDQPRTMMSGQIMIDAMFSRKNASSSSVSQVIPWHVGDFENSNLHINVHTCPRLAWMRHIRQTSDRTYQLRLNRAKEYHLLEQLSQYINTSASPLLLFDCFITSLCQNFSMDIPRNLVHDLLQLVQDRATLEALYRTSEFAKAASAGLVRDIIARLQLKSGRPRLALISAHDGTISMFLGAFGGPEWLDHWPAYASHVVLELYESGGDRKGKQHHWIRVLYQGKPLTLPGQASTLCRLEDFLKAAAFAFEPERCKVSVAEQQILDTFENTIRENSDDDDDDDAWWWISSVFFLLLGMVLGIAGPRGWTALRKLNLDHHKHKSRSLLSQTVEEEEEEEVLEKKSALEDVDLEEEEEMDVPL